MDKKILLSTYIGDQYKSPSEQEVSSNGLLFCPFCGNKARVSISKGTIQPDNAEKYRIICKECYAGTAWTSIEKIAIEEWNRRVGPKTKDEWRKVFEQFVELLYSRSK